MDRDKADYRLSSRQLKNFLRENNLSRVRVWGSFDF